MAKVENYKQAFDKRDSYQIGQEYKNHREMMMLKRKPNASLFDADIDDVAKGVALVNLLEERKEKGDAEATYQYAVTQLSICERMLSPRSSFTPKTCEVVEENLRKVAKQNDQRAMIILGSMYEQGVWFEKSNFVAAEWFLKAAQQYEKSQDREKMLTYLEKASILSPDSPAVQAYKNKVLKIK